MTKLNRKSLFVLIPLAVLIAHFVARAYLHRIEPLPPKCLWNQKSFGGCPPLEATLDVRTSRDPIGNGSTVWYRVTISNRSDKSLRIRSDFFISNAHVNGAITAGLGGRLLVKDSRGTPLPAASTQNFADPNPPGIDSSSQRIIPYEFDTSNLDPYVQTTYFKHDPTRFSNDLLLPPSLGVTTSSNILKPHRIEIRSVATREYVGTAMVPVPIEKAETWRFATPLTGFRRMAEYEFKQAGTYTATFRFDGLVFVEPALTAPHAPISFFESAARFLASPLERFDSGSIELHVESNPAEFQVDR